MSAFAKILGCLVVLQMSSAILGANQCGGSLCDNLPASSCLDHLKRGSTTDGYYKIYNEDDDDFDTVYCDMETDSASAWTLVESWALANKDEDAFKKHPFKTNAPIDEKSANFDRYRMSQPQMVSLKSESTHWRATCSFPVDGIDGRDTIRGNFTDFDIMTFTGSGNCKPIDYGNIRGNKCGKCTARFWSAVNSRHLVIDSYYSAPCGLNANPGSVIEEDNFGYNVKLNPEFRCHQNANSTTNWWFGGYTC